MEKGKLEFGLVELSPYSSDLAPMDLKVFLHLEVSFKSHRFDKFTELSYAIQRAVAWFDSAWFVDMSDQWTAKYEGCVDCEENYLDKYTNVMTHISSHDVYLSTVTIPGLYDL